MHKILQIEHNIVICLNDFIKYNDFTKSNAHINMCRKNETTKGEEMDYNFDEEISLRGSGSIKWDQWEDENILGMANADMDFKAADCVIEALKKTAEQGMFDYHYKPDEHYQTIINWYNRKFGWTIKKEWILSAPGVWVAVHICFEAFTRPGENIIVQTPHFHPIQVIADRMGRHIVTNPMILKNGKYEIDFDDFKQKIIEKRPAVYFMVNLQNPTGRLFTEEEVRSLMEICCMYHVLVISDEVHSNLRYGRKHTPAPSVSEEAQKNAIILNAASKAYNTMDLTYCVIVAPDKHLRRILTETLESYSLDFATNLFSVAGTTAAFSEEADEWLDEVTGYLETSLDIIFDYFEKNIPQIIPIRPEGSFLVWLDCRDLGMTQEQLMDLFITKARVGVTSGEPYGPEGIGFVRLNFGCTHRILKEALRRINEAVADCFTIV